MHLLFLESRFDIFIRKNCIVILRSQESSKGDLHIVTASDSDLRSRERCLLRRAQARRDTRLECCRRCK